MGINKIYLDDFLTFGKGSELGFPANLSIFVGPNGLGKTNVFRAIQYVATLLTKLPSPIAPANYVRKGSSVFKVKVDVTLAEEEMLALQSYFVCAMVNEEIGSG